MARPASIGPVDAAGAEILNRMVRRIVRSVKPLRVILFGSQARGDAHQGSDVDLLIVVPDDANKKLAWRRARAAVDGAWGAGCDILVATPADIMRRGNLVGDVLRPALREGHVVYDAPGMAERNRELEAGPVTEDERLGATRQWMRLARADLMTAEMAVQRPDIDPYPPSYLSQQSAEKALKAILVFLQLDYPLTHDLDRVRGSIPDDWGVKKRFSDLKSLTEWIFKARYPGDWEPPTLADAQEATQQARAIYDGVVADLRAHGLELGPAES